MANLLETPARIISTQLDRRVIFPDHPDYSTWVDRLRIAPMFSLDLETYASAQAIARLGKLPRNKKVKLTKLKKNIALNPFENTIRLIQIGVSNEKQGPTVPEDSACLMFDLHDPRHQVAFEHLFPTFKNCIENEKQFIVGQYLLFDLLTLRVKYGIRAQKTADTMVMSNLLYAGIREYKHSLQAICDREGIPIDKTEQLSDWSAPELTNSQLNYAARDVLVMFPLANILWKKLSDAGASLTTRVENDFVATIVEMEFNGLPVNVDILDEIYDEYVVIQKELLKPILRAWDNIGKVECAIPGLMVARKSFEITKDKGPESDVIVLLRNVTGDNTITDTNKTTLSEFNHLEVVRNLQLWRTVSTQKAYIDNVRLGLRKTKRGWVVSGGLRQLAGLHGDSADSDKSGAGAGRTASGQKTPYHAPNLQNASDPGKYPEELRAMGMRSPREAFVAPKGMKFLVSDLSAAHARIATELSQDPALLAGYRKNVDNHILVASTLARLKGLDWSAMPAEPIKDQFDFKSLPDAKPLRKLAKNGFYGWLNFSSPATFQKTCKDGGIIVELDLCEGTIKGMQETYKGLYGYMLKLHKHYCNPDLFLVLSKRNNEGDPITYSRLQSKLGGRIVYTPCENKKDWKTGEKTGVYKPKISDCLAKTWLSIEATAIKDAANKAYQAALKNPQWEFKLGALVHDEIDAWCNEEYALESATALLKSTDEGLGMFVHSIPVNDNTDPSKLVCSSWVEK